MALIPQGKAIQALYRDYRDGKLLVNRRYQRKLVWTLDEKRRLIDSILRGYPIPLILLAERRDAATRDHYEIMDGIQRLHSICTFIENAFDYEGHYFDVTQLARAKQAADDGAFKPKDGAAVLSPSDCAAILDYQLAITVYPTEDEDDVTEVFGRINSGGRHLSYQEQRQAGVTSAFSELVRTLAAELRGDVSKDVLLLAEMPEISIDSARDRHGYGVTAEQTVWCRQGILSVKQLKESEDEQIVADIAASVLHQEPLAFSRELLDRLYDVSTDEGRRLETTLAAYGSERLSSEVKSTMSVLQQVVEGACADPNYLRSVVRPGTRNPIKAPFYAIFMAFFDLIVREQKTPDAPQGIISALTRLSHHLRQGTHYETTQNRVHNIDVTKGLVQNHFVDRVPPALGHGPGLAIDVINALRRSRIETARYEVKQGILRLDQARQVDEDLLCRLPQTACGIANVGPDATGFIFIGVADTNADAARVELLDGVTPKAISDRYLVGVDREAAVLGESLEGYVRRIVSAFQNADISEPLKTQLLASFDCVEVNGLTVVRIAVRPQTKVSFVNNQAFGRENSSTVTIDGAKLLAIGDLFRT